MKATIKKSGLEVFVREELTPTNYLNTGKIVVSKQPTGMCVFCVEKEDLIFHNK